MLYLLMMEHTDLQFNFIVTYFWILLTNCVLQDKPLLVSFHVLFRACQSKDANILDGFAFVHLILEMSSFYGTGRVCLSNGSNLEVERIEQSPSSYKSLPSMQVVCPSENMYSIWKL